MDVVKVFVLGRSGSGKTTVVNYIKLLAREKGWNAIHIKDYPILYEMFQKDIKENGGKFEPAAYGGFKVVDFAAFNNVLKVLEELIQRKEKELRKSEAHEIILIEFARRSYREVLRIFSDDFLRDAYFFYIEADVDTCVQRIQQRVASFTPEKRLQDHHYVPEAILRSYFNQDDWDYMAHKFKKDFGITKEVAAYRNIGSYIDLLEQVERFMELVFVKESIYTEQPVNV
jgi:adenylate kinase family enzyme